MFPLLLRVSPSTGPSLQVAQVFGYHLSLFVDGEPEEQPEGEEQQQLQQALPLAPLQVNLTAAAARLSGGRARAAAGSAGGGGSGSLLSPVGRVSGKVPLWLCFWALAVRHRQVSYLVVQPAVCCPQPTHTMRSRRFERILPLCLAVCNQSDCQHNAKTL